VRYDVLAIIITNVALWDVTACSLVRLHGVIH